MPPLLARALCLNTHICASIAAAALAASHTTVPGEQAALRARLYAAVGLCPRRTQSLRAVREFCAGAIEKLFLCLQHETPSHRRLILCGVLQRRDSSLQALSSFHQCVLEWIEHKDISGILALLEPRFDASFKSVLKLIFIRISEMLFAPLEL